MDPRSPLAPPSESAEDPKTLLKQPKLQKSPLQVFILRYFYLKSTTRALQEADYLRIERNTGLARKQVAPTDQIYKWLWDEQQRDAREPLQAVDLSCLCLHKRLQLERFERLAQEDQGATYVLTGVHGDRRVLAKLQQLGFSRQRLLLRRSRSPQAVTRESNESENPISLNWPTAQCDPGNGS